MVEQTFDVLGQNVGLEVHVRSRLQGSESSAFKRFRDERDLEPVIPDRADREAHAVNRDRALLDDVLGEIAGEQKAQYAGKAFVGSLEQLAHAIDVALHNVTVEAVA